MTPLKSLLLCFAITFATPAQAVDRNLYLIALAGQSNMTGKGNVNDLPLGFPKNAPRLWNFTNAYTWELAKEPVHRKILALAQHWLWLMRSLVKTLM